MEDGLDRDPPREEAQQGSTDGGGGESPGDAKPSRGERFDELAGGGRDAASVSFDEERDGIGGGRSEDDEAV